MMPDYSTTGSSYISTSSTPGLSAFETGFSTFSSAFLLPLRSELLSGLLTPGL